MNSPRHIDVSIIPSARGIEKNLANELAPVSGIAAAEGTKAGKALGTNAAKGLAAADLAGGIEKSATKATGTGQRILTTFAQRTGGLFQSLDRQLGNFGGPFTGNLTTIGTSLRTVAAGEKNVALGASELQRVGTAAYVGLGLAAVGFGAVSIKTALGAEQAQAQLEQAVKATGHSYEDVSGQIDAAGQRLAKFGFDQEEVNAALAKLTRASKDPAKALDLIGTAADIARARNLALGDASQILVNIEAGRVRGLAQLGISTKDSTGKTVDATEAVRRITALYGGSAAANAKTYAGELQAAGATAHNLEEELGGKLLPVVANLGNEVVAGVHGLEDINKATGGWLGTLGGAAFVAGAVAVTVSKVSSGVSKLIDLFGIQTASTSAASAAATAEAASMGTLTAAQAANTGAASAASAAQVELAASSAEASGAATILGASYVTLNGLLVPATAEIEAVTIAETESAASATAAAAGTGLLSTSFTGLAAPLAAVAGGFLLGKKAGDEINKTLIGSKPNVDKLTASLIDLEKHGGIAPNASKFAADLNAQVSGHGPLEFGQGFADAFTGGGAHRAKSDAAVINESFKSLLQTEGIDKTNLALGRFITQFRDAGGNVQTLVGDMGPFFSALDLAQAKEDKTSGSTGSLAQSFGDLAKSFDDQSAVLGIADSLDTAKAAVDDLNQLKLDALGKGEKSIAAAHAEAQAQQSLTDAYGQQETAATSLADARQKLAQFNSPTDQRIRSLELQNIQDRVVTTPEEARQKEIDLLQFSEDTANKQADLQKSVADAEHGVTSATQGVAKAQQQVSDASAARRKVQTDAAAAIAGGERKAQEAILAAGKAINDADVAGQLGKGNEQLDIYVSLLDGLSKALDPNSTLTKNLDRFLTNVQLTKTIAGSIGPAGPRAPSGLTVATTFTSPTPSAAKPSLDYHPTITVQGRDQPTRSELDILNRKQAIRLSNGGVRF